MKRGVFQPMMDALHTAGFRNLAQAYFRLLLSYHDYDKISAI